MTKSLAICVLLAIIAMLGVDEKWRIGTPVVNAALADDTRAASPGSDNSADACAGVSLSRNLKYGESDRNVLDVATGSEKPSAPRPVLLFIAGESFAADSAASSGQEGLRDQAMCLAAQHGMVGASMIYRLAPAGSWPAGARDVAAAISWMHQNADLFGGDAKQIVAIGYSVGAFHLASFLAHKELQNTDSDVAGAVLISGIYRAGDQIGDGERSYFGTDANKYDARSAFPGILEVEEPIVLAWSSADPPQLVAQGERLKERLCGAGHCPRTALLASRYSPASVFGGDGTDETLARRTRQLLSQIETRGMP